MEPTLFQVACWWVLGIGGLLALIIAPHINPQFNPKGDDPYRHCPKEEE